MSSLQTQIKELFRSQLENWPLAHKNFSDLRHVQTKTFHIDGREVCVQFNPARMVSSGAKVDAKSIANRKCFLCAENRPVEQQGIVWGNYTVLVNPFPIFPEHFTIPRNEHVPQQIKPYFADMLALAHEMSDYLVFYNGPRCGASAPDHMHFQAGSKNFLPLINQLRNQTIKNSTLPTVIEISAAEAQEAEARFDDLYDHLVSISGETVEPMMNIVCLYENGRWHCYILPRKQFRPWQYTAEGDRQLLVSPATVEMCGMFITPVKAHFDRITAADIVDILKQASLSETSD